MEAKSFYIRLLVLFLIAVTLIFLVCLLVYIKTKTKDVDLADYIIDPEMMIELGNATKNDCYITQSYCFDKNDCTANCTNGFDFECITGMCVGTNIIETQVVNECNSKTGQFGYLVGDTQLGVYNTICKSIDPGVAMDNPNEENRICVNGTIDIDYRKKFPSTNDCDCKNLNRIIIPSSKMVRETAVCVNDNFKRYFEL